MLVIGLSRKSATQERVNRNAVIGLENRVRATLASGTALVTADLRLTLAGTTN